MSTQDQHFENARSWQEYYDSELQNVGVRAPAPVLGQRAGDYRRHTCELLRKEFLPQSHELSQVNFNSLKGDALRNMEKMLVEDAVPKARVDPRTVPFGEFRQIERVNPQNGQKEISFYGQDNFVRFMGRPGRVVLGFRGPDGLFRNTGTNRVIK